MHSYNEDIYLNIITNFTLYLNIITDFMGNIINMLDINSGFDEAEYGTVPKSTYL